MLPRALLNEFAPQHLQAPYYMQCAHSISDPNTTVGPIPNYYYIIKAQIQDFSRPINSVNKIVGLYYIIYSHNKITSMLSLGTSPTLR